MLIKFLLLSILAIFSINCSAVSFDCQKASTFVEQAICQDNDLSGLDDELALSFNTAITNSKNPKALKQQQLEWLKNKRARCQTNACLDQVYRERIAILNALAGANNKISGQYLRYDENNKPDYNSASLTIITLEKNKIKVIGSATWVGDAKAGNVNTGEIEGSFNLQNNQINYKDEAGCQFILLFGKNALTINNDNGQCGGMSVSFNGYYKKVN